MTVHNIETLSRHFGKPPVRFKYTHTCKYTTMYIFIADAEGLLTQHACFLTVNLCVCLHAFMYAWTHIHTVGTCVWTHAQNVVLQREWHLLASLFQLRNICCVCLNHQAIIVIMKGELSPFCTGTDNDRIVPCIIHQGRVAWHWVCPAYLYSTQTGAV